MKPAGTVAPTSLRGAGVRAAEESRKSGPLYHCCRLSDGPGLTLTHVAEPHHALPAS